MLVSFQKVWRTPRFYGFQLEFGFGLGFGFDFGHRYSIFNSKPPRKCEKDSLQSRSEFSDFFYREFLSNADVLLTDCVGWCKYYLVDVIILLKIVFHRIIHYFLTRIRAIIFIHWNFDKKKFDSLLDSQNFVKSKKKIAIKNSS